MSLRRKTDSRGSYINVSQLYLVCFNARYIQIKGWMGKGLICCFYFIACKPFHLQQLKYDKHSDISERVWVTNSSLYEGLHSNKIPC